MVVKLLERYLEKRKEAVRADNITGNISRLTKLPPAPNGTFATLSLRPRQANTQLPAGHAVWPLEVLSLPKVGTFEQIHARANDLLETIQEATEAKIVHAQAATDARTKVEAAYQFLQWPQNRKRVAEILRTNPELTPSRVPSQQGEAGTLLDTCAYLLHRTLSGITTSE